MHIDTTAINQLKQSLRFHPLYEQISSIENLRHFMQGHVYCTWDFMSLLKSLQQQLTQTSIPWLPPKHPALARLINEIVTDEETDLIGDQIISHFELYYKAMQEVGCSTGDLDSFIDTIEQQTPISKALSQANLPLPVQSFVNTTFSMLDKPVEIQAAVFFHGREDIVPSLFIQIVRQLESQGLKCPSFLTYLERHIEVDGDKHGPLANRLLNDLLTGKPALQIDAQLAVETALKARLQLWDYLATIPASMPLHQGTATNQNVSTTGSLAK